MSSSRELIDAAVAARKSAYCPYSGYAVGAAVEDEQGRIFSGCNVENVSYPAGLCAERSAIAQMVAQGGRRVRALVVATRDGGTPCGICLQVLLEFAGDPEQLTVLTVDQDRQIGEYTLKRLFPNGFSSSEVARKNLSNLQTTL